MSPINTPIEVEDELCRHEFEADPKLHLGGHEGERRHPVFRSLLLALLGKLPQSSPAWLMERGSSS